MTAAIRASHLSKRYRATWALRDCDLEVPEGRITALVGPNGAGKSTLLKLAMGLLSPSSGELEVLGRSPLSDPAAVLAHVGLMAENRPLYPYFTVADILRLGRELNHTWDDAAARARLRRHGIPLDRQVRRLSSGQQAQVSLSLALGKRPRLLLLDEPAAALDPLARRELMSELVGTVAADGVSVVLASHLIADVERVCDHLVILGQGRVQLAGGIDELMEQHRILVGPPSEATRVAAGAAVISARHAERESALLVRGASQSLPSGWRTEAVGLEDLVLAYLANPARGGGVESSPVAAEEAS